MLDKLLVFDIETIPDTSVLVTLTGSETADPVEMRKELEQYHMAVSGGNPFPRQPFHRIVSIAMLVADISRDNGYEYYRNVRVSSLSSLRNTEKQLVEKFFNYVCEHLPRLVSYNGKTFDLPVLKYRAMKHAVAAEKLFKSGDRWNSYANRYSINWHCDLLESLSDFGMSARCRMAEVCSILGIPGKINGMDGSRVADMFDSERLEDIDNYCEMDVLSTYLLYLSQALLRGIVTMDGFYSMCRDLRNYLTEQKSNHFRIFLDEWKNIDSRGLFL
ncbi:MAG: 3'-5' exonuclease [Rickettsiales bacterium]|jgi:predicted PolB exonuclease-like 3'-5' exonuclease|nr:3'-5' exonuclease [Rickettsiales bacterium]